MPAALTGKVSGLFETVSAEVVTTGAVVSGEAKRKSKCIAETADCCGGGTTGGSPSAEIGDCQVKKMVSFSNRYVAARYDGKSECSTCVGKMRADVADVSVITAKRPVGNAHPLR